MIFALSLPALVLMTVGGVDIHRASTVRVNLQDALDAAALAAARSPATAPADIQAIGLKNLKANLKAYPNITLLEDQTSFILNADQIVVADAKVNVKAIVANLVLPPYGQFMDDYLPVAAHSEVNRSSKNLEVALVLDITGSMAGQKLTDMKSAAKQLVDIVVQDLQSPWYSKMSLVPYSLGVNMGAYANTARGAAVQSVNISNLRWGAGTRRNISAVNKTTGVITSNGHGFVNGDIVWVWNASGMTQINNRRYRIASAATNTFKLEWDNAGVWTAVDMSSWSNYSNNGRVQKCFRTADCFVQITTASNHGLVTGNGVYITDVGGATQANSKGYWATRVDDTNYHIGVVGATWGTYTANTGKSWCGEYGCQWRVYLDNTNTIDWKTATDCSSERFGAQKFSDVAPTSAKVGFNYQRALDDCPDSAMIPLTTSKTNLKNTIDAFVAEGTTAGHIGAAWGWYTISPSWNAVWPSSGAGAYNDEDLLKAVILMTDGEFNVTYCSGVYSSDSPNASDTDKIRSCNAPNGSAFAQAEALCNAMKNQGVLVYTVGFQVPTNGPAADIMRNCATRAEMAYLPASGADLTEAFKAIGRDITRLRISK